MLYKLVKLQKAGKTIKISSTQTAHIKNLLKEGWLEETQAPKAVHSNPEIKDEVLENVGKNEENEENEGAESGSIEEKQQLKPKKRRGRPRKS